MISKKELLRGSHLYPVRNIIKAIKNNKLSNGVYAILDKDIIGDKILRVANRVLSSGVDMVQLRDKTSSLNEILKTAKAIKKITKRYDIPFVINDRLDVALAIDADGLHIGQGDINISLAKKLFLGKGKLIGLSVSNLKQALKAKREGADYLGVGPVFRTPIKGGIKPKGLRLLDEVKKLNIPFFAIGGIDCKNIHKLVKGGFKNVATIRAICEAKDPHIAVRTLKEAIG